MNIDGLMKRYRGDDGNALWSIGGRVEHLPDRAYMEG